MRVFFAVRRTTVAVGLVAASLAGCNSMPHHRPQAQLTIPEKCGDLNFPVYFEPKAAALTHAARELIQEAGHTNNDCRVARVDVVGLSGGPGSTASLDLSHRRAEAVAKALAAAGFPAPAFGTVAAGMASPAGPDGMPDMMQRRADVTIHYTPAT